MLELIVGTYGVLCWLVFKKFKIIPANTYTVSGAVLEGFFFCLPVDLAVCVPQWQATAGCMRP